MTKLFNSLVELVLAVLIITVSVTIVGGVILGMGSVVINSLSI